MLSERNRLSEVQSTHYTNKILICTVRGQLREQVPSLFLLSRL